MSQENVFNVEAEILSVDIQDISKTASAKNEHVYLKLKVLKSELVSDPSVTLSKDTILVSRPLRPGDRELEPGFTGPFTIGVNNLEFPLFYYWLD